MGRGPPICTNCLVTGQHYNDHRHPWKCPRCGDFNLKGHLWDYILSTQELINARTILHKSRVKSDMQISKKVYRKFMIGDKDPNERYRSWLEENIGRQGVLWNWDIVNNNNFDTLQIEFFNTEHALLFELSCQ